MNFASLFSQIRMSNNSISELIDTPKVTLDRLLDEDSFVSQFKNGNSKIQQFMKYDKYQTLVKYITEVGPPDDRKRSFKFPLSACELLCSDSNLTIDFFFGDNPIIVKEEVPVSPKPAQQDSNAKDAAPSEDKPKTNGKVVIKDKLQGQQSNAEALINEMKSQNVKSENSDENASNENIDDEDKSENINITATPKVKFILKEMEPLRDALFSYFKGDVNYTLAGYVSKVFIAFFTKKPLMLMKFLLDPQRFKDLLCHIESRSVGQLISKLLTYESADLMEERKEAYGILLEKVSQDQQVYVIANLAAAICEIIEKVAGNVKNANQNSILLSQIFFQPDLITRVISNVMSEYENVLVYNAPILQTYLTSVPIVIPQKNQTIESLKLLLLSFIRKSLQKLKIKKQVRPKLGFGRMKIVEIISFVLKENILNARELAASESKFFPILLNLCKNYQYNNVLHNEIVKIVQIALSEPQDSKFLKSLLNNDVLLNFVVGQAEEDQKIRSGTGSQKARKGYIGHIVAICRKIQEVALTNQTANKIAERKQFTKVMEDLVNKQVSDGNKNLAGYSMRRGVKNPIVFMKDEIIKEHLKFLASTPTPVFDSEPERINIEHPDLLEAQKVETEIIVTNLGKVSIQQDQEHKIDPGFFLVHLKYNLDDLINDL